ncbi:hypothetical protein CYMTET_54524 [Cymbomonas tetramitiformis]|uniref:Uncharacterized protein n=1 Tax=Cymbomonas tetramitiformis TaxID=36881 RepID=A0AAE0BFW8_9CHLO|nr:hypothetical protein CYMTET_54524 [Cymbomonas tetramitiformis]
MPPARCSHEGTQDPHANITNFNAALVLARRRNTLDVEEVKGFFIEALDKKYYAPVVNRLMLHDQPAKLTETTEDQSAINDLTLIILELKRQMKHLTDRMDGTNSFTPRAARPSLKLRFAARDLPVGGNWLEPDGAQEAGCLPQGQR